MSLTRWCASKYVHELSDNSGTRRKKTHTNTPLQVFFPPKSVGFLPASGAAGHRALRPAFPARPGARELRVTVVWTFFHLNPGRVTRVAWNSDGGLVGKVSDEANSYISLRLPQRAQRNKFHSSTSEKNLFTLLSMIGVSPPVGGYR